MINLGHITSNIYKPQGSLTRLMLSRMIRQISATLMHFYSAVFVYQVVIAKGYNSHLAIIVVLLFYLVAFLSKVTFEYISQYISYSFGFKNTIRLSVLPYMIYIFYLRLIPFNFAYLFIAAFFSGINAGLFWWGYHGYFVKKGQKKHFGVSIGEANLLETLAAILTPLGGAFIITYLGYNTLFYFSLFCVVVSAILLGKGSKTRQKHIVNIGEIVGLVESHKLSALAYWGAGVESLVAAVIWPLFLYLFFGKIISLGLIVTLSVFVAAIFSLVIGNKVDIEGGDKWIKFGSIALFSSWAIKFFSRNLGSFVITDSLGNFGERMISLPLNTISYKKAIEDESAKAILFYEFTEHAGVVICILITVSYVFFGFDLTTGFVLAALASLLPLAWALKRN